MSTGCASDDIESVVSKRLAAAGLEDFIATKFGVGYLIGD